MIRRRPPRRPARRPLRRRVRPPRPAVRAVVPPRLRQALERGHRAMESGDFDLAARIFGEEADKAHNKGQFAAASRLALQCARAHLAGDNISAALERGKQALQFMAQSGRPGRIPAALNRMVEQLRQRGYEAEADQLQREVEERLAEVGLNLQDAQAQAVTPARRRGQLPGKCSTCAGPLNPNEVEWYDSHSAECPYCGSVLKAT